ncbi:MAG: DUF3375 family protein, partial [Campylobacterales bacterium]|nr:DUF3375 family protein [Campylobacterales bacterium]
KEFVGSRTKFNVIFELLEDLEFETHYSDEERIKALEAQKEAIDNQIEKIKTKQDIRFDSSRIKEHFMLLEETARKLKHDFTQIEYNFRELNTMAMEQIATREDGKAEVLDSIFLMEDSIREQNQGKSFFAFWQLLTDTQKSEKFSQMLDNLYQNEIIKAFDKEQSLRGLKYELLKNAQKVSSVSSSLIEQLRRYIDDRVWMENRRILELCKSIEKRALSIKENIPKSKNFYAIKGQKASIESVFEKPLYELKTKHDFVVNLEQKGSSIDIDSLYQQFFIDEEELHANIKKILLHQPQCSLEDISKAFGIKKGVAEVIGYLSIAKNSDNALIDNDRLVTLQIKDSNENIKSVKMPKVVFVKSSEVQ